MPNPAFSGRGFGRARAGAAKGKQHSPAVSSDGHRRAADAIVGRGRGEAEKAVVKPQVAGESEHAAKREQKARSPVGEGEAGGAQRAS